MRDEKEERRRTKQNERTQRLIEKALKTDLINETRAKVQQSQNAEIFDFKRTISPKCKEST